MIREKEYPPPPEYPIGSVEEALQEMAEPSYPEATEAELKTALAICRETLHYVGWNLDRVSRPDTVEKDLAMICKKTLDKLPVLVMLAHFYERELPELER